MSARLPGWLFETEFPWNTITKENGQKEITPLSVDYTFPGRCGIPVFNPCHSLYMRSLNARIAVFGQERFLIFHRYLIGSNRFFLF